MATPDNPDQVPDVSRATHWNTRRDPVSSFRCPFCGWKVRIEELFGGEEALGPGNGHLVICDICHVGILGDDWQYYKAMELLQEE